MKIVVLDGYTENPGDLSWDALRALGDLTVYDRTSLTDENEAIARIGDAEMVFTNKTPITKRVIDACPSMKFISLLATGYNVVDYVYAAQKADGFCGDQGGPAENPLALAGDDASRYGRAHANTPFKAAFTHCSVVP